VNVPVIKTRGQSLYMMPDGVLVYDSRGVGFVEYRDMQINASTTRFIETSPPSDALIVGNTWRYANKKGGPDRRFNNNKKISICLYGVLKITSNSGMNIHLMTSKHDSPSNFYAQINRVLMGEERLG
jgi:hypothetical protein